MPESVPPAATPAAMPSPLRPATMLPTNAHSGAYFTIHSWFDMYPPAASTTAFALMSTTDPSFATKRAPAMVPSSSTMSVLKVVSNR
mgnify:CR=1 FL=1